MSNKAVKLFRIKSQKKIDVSENDAERLFSRSNYHLNPKEDLSEFEKAYKGLESELDKISYKDCYATSDKKEKRDGNGNKKVMEDDEAEEATFLDSNYNKQVIESTVEEPKTLVIKATAKIAKSESDEKVDRTLSIAEDFARCKNIISIGKALCMYNGYFFEILSDEDAQKLIFKQYRKEIGKNNPLSVLRTISGLLKFCAVEEHEEFPVNEKLIVFNNGTLDVHTGLFRKNSPKDIASSALGISYRPGYMDMPHTKKFLQTVADGDDDLYERMLQAIGYMLSNDIKAKSFFYLEGVGNAGKSRFCDLVASFFPVSGANAVSRIALQDLDGKFALANLVNVKLNISEDLPDAPLSINTVSKIKMISDSNRLEAEAKYVQAFSFRPTCKLLFASNHPLRLKEYDEAFVNRVVYIPFVNAIPKNKQDKDILRKMQVELPALFNYAFAAYKRLIASGYVWAGTEKFKPRIEVSGVGISYCKENVMREFVEQCCVIDQESITASADLQEVYHTYCFKNNYSPILGDRFSRELMGVLPDSVTRIKIGNQRRGFKGIKLLKSYTTNEFNSYD